MKRKVIYSKDLMQLIFNRSIDLLCVFDKEGCFVSVNKAASNILGYTEDDLIGQHYINYVHPDDRQKTIETANSIMSGIDIKDFENRYTHKNGTNAIIMWAATWDKEDQLMYCIGRDITNLKRTEEALIKSNERFYYATKATSDAIWEWNLKTNEILWGENYYPMFGYSSENKYNHISNWYIRIHPEDCEKVIKTINNCIENGETIWSQEYRYKHADGHYVWVLDKGIILKDKDNKPERMIGAMQDNTQRKLWEDKLIQSETRFKSMVQDSSDMTCIINIDGDYEYVSPSAINVLGFTPEYFIGKNAFQFIHPDDIEEAVMGLKSIYDINAITLEPFRFQNSKGEWRWIETRLSNQLNNQHIKGIIANSRDVTEKINTQNELRTLALIAQQTNDPVLLTDTNRRIVWVNEAFINLYKYKREEIIGKNPQQLLKGTDTKDSDLKKIEQAILTKSLCHTDILYYTKNQEKRLVEVQIQPVFNEKGKLINYFSIHHDITEKRKLQLKLQKEQKEKQLNITKAVIAAQERERNELGKELHDNVNQLLTTAKLYLQLIKNDSSDADDLLAKSMEILNSAILDIRRLSHVLTYSSVEFLSLEQGLYELISTINVAKKTNINLEINIDEEKINHGIKVSIYRIIQEQINNILKHSSAKQAFIELRDNEKNITLKIEDNGKGFDTLALKNGIGLNNIESRVLAYNGKMEIHSEIDKGCTLFVEFPITC
jgi:PAS domain S-box-containing protein